MLRCIIMLPEKALEVCKTYNTTSCYIEIPAECKNRLYNWKSCKKATLHLEQS